MCNPKSNPEQDSKSCRPSFSYFQFFAVIVVVLFANQRQTKIFYSNFIWLLCDFRCCRCRRASSTERLRGSRKRCDREAETGDAHLFVWEISSGGHRKYYFDDNNLGLLFNLNTQTFGKVEKCWTITRKKEKGKRDSSDGRKTSSASAEKDNSETLQMPGWPGWPGWPVTCSHRPNLTSK